MKLHATGVEKLRREKTYGLHADGNSLYFRLRDNGASWIFRFKIPLKNAPWATADDYVAVDLATGRTLKGETFDAAKHKRIGRTVELGLGSYPTVTLADARKKRDKLLAEIDQRRDPRKFEREDALPVKGKTFQEYAEEYIAEKEKGLRSAKHKQQWRNTLRDYAYPLLGKMLPKDIRMADVLAVIKPMWATKTETASRVRQRIEMVLSYAFVVEEIDRLNPARWAGNLSETGLQSPRALMDQRAEAEGKEHRHHAAAPWQDVPAIMDKLRAKADVTSALALRFSILTACRSTECRALDWSEIDIDNAVWTLPPARSKNKKAHAVPLNAEAIEILKIMRAKKLEGERVFPGAKRNSLLSDVAINKVLHAAYPGVTAHGTARSSFRDWVAVATGFSDAVAEAALNHTNPNATEAAYLRTEDQRAIGTPFVG